MSQFQLVLDDELLGFYYKIQDSGVKEDELEKLQKFFKLYRPHLTNYAQLKRLVDNNLIEQAKFDRLKIAILMQTQINDRLLESAKLSLEELVKLTQLQVVLSEKNSCSLPYINIYSNQFDANYIMSFNIGDNRDYLRSYLKQLFIDITSIVVRDIYMHGPINKCFEKFFKELLPIKPLAVYHSIPAKDLSRIKGKKSPAQEKIAKLIQHSKNQWKFCPDTMIYSQNDLHDRYIRIDNKLEIILSSGIEYLFDTNKEITCIFRALK